MLYLAIKGGFDDKSSFGQRAGSIGLFQFFDDPLDEMRRFDREGISAEFDIDALDDSILELLLGDISVFICSIERKIFSSVLVFHIKRIAGNSDGERSYAIDEFYDGVIILFIGQVCIIEDLSEFVRHRFLDISGKEHGVAVSILDDKFAHYEIPILIRII